MGGKSPYSPPPQMSKSCIRAKPGRNVGKTKAPENRGFRQHPESVRKANSDYGTEGVGPLDWPHVVLASLQDGGGEMLVRVALHRGGFRMNNLIRNWVCAVRAVDSVRDRNRISWLKSQPSTVRGGKGSVLQTLWDGLVAMVEQLNPRHIVKAADRSTRT